MSYELAEDVARMTWSRCPSEQRQAVWCEWFRRHTVDSNDVLIPGWVEADYLRYRIRYLTLKNLHGPDDPDGPPWEPVEIVKTVQLEARPAAFPT